MHANTPQFSLAKTWATMDGKLEAFLAEANGTIPHTHPAYTGHYAGYMVEADELLLGLEADGFQVVPA
jgi:hypothetical protein